MAYVQTACGFCDWDGAPLEEAFIGSHGAKALLCEVCRNTPAGNALLYPEQHLADRDVLRTQAWGINYLASLIRPPAPVHLTQVPDPEFEDEAPYEDDDMDIDWASTSFRPEIEALLLAIGLGTLDIGQATGSGHTVETIRAARMMNLVTTARRGQDGTWSAPRLGNIDLVATENGRAWLTARVS